MSAERIGVVVMSLACVGLIGWNMSLSGQLAELRVQQTQAAAAAPMDKPMAVADDHRGERLERMKARKAGGGWERGGDRHEPTEAGEGEAEDERGHRGPRRRDWSAMRADMETRTIDTVEAYGAQNSWSSESTEEVLTILLDSSDAIAEVWNQASAGDLTHYQARKEMMGIRGASQEDIIALIGEESYEGLDEHLWEARHEVMREAHEGSDDDADNAK